MVVGSTKNEEATPGWNFDGKSHRRAYSTFNSYFYFVIFILLF